MIFAIESNLPTFKNIRFEPGLNIVVADKTEKRSSRKTRNGAGKSSLVEIMSFLLGGNVERNALPSLPALNEYIFSLLLDVDGVPVVASRSGKEPNRIRVGGARAEDFLRRCDFSSEAKNSFIPNNEWKRVLGRSWFGLDDSIQKSANNNPTFRSLISYFIRRQTQGGFINSEKYFKNQKTWNYQVNLSYLFGLDWRISQDWQRIRELEKSVKELKAALKKGALGGEVIDSSSSLFTRIAIAEKDWEELRERLESYRVIEDYKRLESEASSLTAQINALADKNTSDALLLEELEASLSQERALAKPDLKSLYKQVGVVLPDAALSRFEDVERFHQGIIANRRHHLEREIQDAKARINKRRSKQDTLDSRRSEIMRVLESSGALETFSALQSELTKKQTELDHLKKKFDMARALEDQRSELTIERGHLFSRLRKDLSERKSTVKNAILTFEELSRNLYEEPGSLSIRATENGPSFETEIQGKRSKGKNNMQIFCFDMTLAILGSGRRSPGFLIHDSHLFDGADERQISRALKVARNKCEEHGFQYIVTMNTDIFDKLSTLPELEGEIDLNDYVNPVRLTDATEDGGLFGFRFG